MNRTAHPLGRRTALLVLVVGLTAGLSAAGARAEPPSAPGAKVGAGLEVKLETKGGVDDEATMKRRASDAVSGYYKALIAADFEQAATFLRSDAVEPIRAGMVMQIERASPAQQKGTLDALGVPDLAALKSMPHTKFFAAYARSQYGVSLQQLAVKEVGAAVHVDEVACAAAEKQCTVKFRLQANGKDGKPTYVPQTMRATSVDGRWLLGFPPPKAPPPGTH